MRPITKKDVKRWRGQGWHFHVYTHEVLGIYIKVSHFLYCYRVNGNGDMVRVSRVTIKRRMRLGHPKKRVKQIMRDGLFSLDEMAIAEAIINGG